MRRTNYDLSTALVAIGAVAVLVSLFLDWYDTGLNAFDVFEITDWLLVALSVGALVVIATEAWSGGGAPSNRLAWICGALAFVVIAQLLDPPPAAREAEREIGAWLALGGAALMVAGAVMAIAQISVTIDVSERERRQRMAAVDARADAGDDEAVGAAPTTAGSASGSGLWQAPSAQSRTPAEDPDRTQPFASVDRSEDDTTSADTSDEPAEDPPSRPRSGGRSRSAGRGKAAGKPDVSPATDDEPGDGTPS